MILLHEILNRRNMKMIMRINIFNFPHNLCKYSILVEINFHPVYYNTPTRTKHYNTKFLL